MKIYPKNGSLNNVVLSGKYPPIDSNLIDFRFPQVKERNLSNGIQLVIIEQHTIPKVYIRLGFDFGTKNDPAEKAGLSQLLSATIKKGTRHHNYKSIVKKIDDIGGELDSLVNEDFFIVHGEFLKEYFEIGLELLSDIIQNAVFPDNELERERYKLIADLENEKSSPEFLAQRRMSKILLAPHPYSLYKTADSLQKVEQEDLKQFHNQLIQNSQPHLIVAGDIGAEEAIEKVEKYFVSWKMSPKEIPVAETPSSSISRLVHIVHRPGSHQTNILMGNRIFKRRHPDYIKMLVMSKVLGGGGSGRLFLDLREKKGYTYGAYSSLQTYKDAGIFIANAEVRTEVAADAIAAFFAQFTKIISEPVSDEELRNAKQYLIGIFPLQNETASSIAALVLNQRLHLLPTDYWDMYIQEIAAANKSDILTVSQRYIKNEEMAIVAVGDADVLTKELGSFGPVSVFDLDDKPIK